MDYKKVTRILYRALIFQLSILVPTKSGSQPKVGVAQLKVLLFIEQIPASYNEARRTDATKVLKNQHQRTCHSHAHFQECG
ncbi:MAG: hypothetical protein JWN76_2154 [Chitinophagaceae bacterium]|nr:hypothetical protein [Chitinophagaceae bacterium]